MKRYIVSAILLVVSLPLLMYGCGEKTSGKMASSQTEQSKSEKLLDKSLELSGKKLSTKERSVALRMLSLNEKDLIQGLTAFLELSGERYPTSLEAKATIPETKRLLKARSVGSNKEVKEKTYDIFFASAFYDKLIREKRNVAYYGDRVTSNDVDKVLMWWKTSEDNYRIIFGDLTEENVSAEQLEELKVTLSK